MILLFTIFENFNCNNKKKTDDSGARHDDQEHGGDGEQAGGGTEIGLGQVSVLQHPRVSRHAVRPHSGRQFSGSATYTAPLTSFSETQPRSSRTAVYWHR